MENNEKIVEIGDFVIKGDTAEALNNVSKFFSWNKQDLLFTLLGLYDPDSDAKFNAILFPEESCKCPYESISVVIDPNDVSNLNDIDPYGWITVEELITFCNRYPKYSYKDALFTDLKDKPSGVLTSAIGRYALGFITHNIGEDGERYHYARVEAAEKRGFKPIYCKLIKY